MKILHYYLTLIEEMYCCCTRFRMAIMTQPDIFKIINSEKKELFVDGSGVWNI